MLHRIAATTTGQAPADSATAKTAHLPTKPEVSGMPAMPSRKNAKTPGDERRLLAETVPAAQVRRLTAGSRGPG